MELILIVIYGVALMFIFCYSLIQIQLVFKYKKYQKLRRERTNSDKALEYYPRLTVQLPIFNEKYVAERLINSIALLNYPNEKLEIQVLDDSTDESQEICKITVQKLLLEGINIQYLHRADRKGYKAGALAEGLKSARGELIAIFDADFLPKKDFLMRIVPHFKDASIGMVQSKWKHINEKYSLLTRLQAFGLDAHFSVEQGGRNAGGHFMNFNGTAGIWRKKAIESAGGWQSDTLTEDLDLSYRAQLKGWKFLFLEEVGAPAELPAEMNALKNQQFRWNKGAAECTRKNLGKVLRAKNISASTKLNAIFHLMNSAVFICIVVLAILSIPILSIKEHHPEYSILFNVATFFLVTLPILAIFYWTSLRQSYKNWSSTFIDFVKLFPAFLSVSMGLSLHNAMAVMEGYVGKKSPFIRTPKFDLTDDQSKNWTSNIYLTKKMSPLIWLEFIFALYFLGGILLGFYYQDYGLMPFHLMLFIGFGYVASFSFAHTFKTAK